jgi:hypothetical protein
MSLKDLFQVKKVLAPVSNEQIAEEIESVQLIDSYSKDKTRVEFAVNYSTASNFAIFGSAEKYYTDTIQRIYSQYPYDGSKKEKLDWYNSSSLLDIWFLENAYPKTTGYATFSPSGWGLSSSAMVSGYGNPASKEYIIIKGGPNTNSALTLKGQFTDTSNQYPKSNVVNSSTNRLSNLQTNLNNGLTLEFWLNKNSFITSSTQKEVIFDLWNNEVSSSSGYGRLTLELSGTTGSPFYITAQSGTSGVFRQNIGSIPTTSSLNGWNHYAVSLYNTSSAIQAKFYLNGELDSTHSFGTSINEITGSLIANIGALRTAPSGTTGVSLGWGKLSASIDDFRFWKEARTSREIGRNYWDSVGGGVNTDDANTTLGFYYKFNEGITTTSSIDSVVLDYSGRVSNGTWVGYTAPSRNTGSAITNEAPDPIIYITHADVVAVAEEYSVIGSDYDRTNNNSIYYSFPNWIIDEDNNGELLNLTQIAASYLDTLYLQIKYFTSLKDHYTNIQIDEKPYPFSQAILESLGMVAPSLFIDAKLMEEVLSKDEERNYEDKLHEIKNIIYQNIYSNLLNIFKTKGTEQSYRNLLRCFGIDESLVKLNIYSNNGQYKLTDNTSNINVKKNSINLNDPDRFIGTIYQYPETGNSNSTSYISGSTGTELDYVPYTFEAEVVFPKKLEQDNNYYFPTLFITSSIFGGHTALTSSTTNLTWGSPDYFNFKVYAVRKELESKDVKFVLSSSSPYPISELSTSFYQEVYENEKWNFAVRIKPTDYDANFVSGTSDTTYTLEFYGVNSDGDTVKNEFSLSTLLTNANGLNFVRQPKRLYFGAEATNFTGSIINSTDIKLLNLRAWSSYLTNDTIKRHSADPLNYGVDDTTQNSYLYQFNNVSVPKTQTLLLNWNFDLVSGSNNGSGIPNVSDGKFIVADSTSGSLLDTRYNTAFNNLRNYQYTGRGDFFLQNDTTMVDPQYLFASKLNQFEDISNSNLINILTTEEQQTILQATRPVNYFFSFEKNMYQTISDEMLKMFATILDFNNLVGEPVNKYRKEYKALGKLRQLFFEKVQNEPDLDKYLDFYKWIDSAVGKFLLQLTPASADTSEGLLNVVESHALERNKHQHKFPTIEFKLPIIEAGAQTINRHLYNWKVGYRPLSNDESDNCLYWNERAERDVAPISSSNSGVNEARKQILNVSLQALNRSFTTPYHFKLDENKAIQGGVNFDNNKNLEFATIALAPHGPMDADSVINVPANYLFAGIPNTSSLLQDCNDVLDPNKKVKYHFTTVHGRDYLSSSLSYGEVLNSKIALPANFISGTINTGYQSQVASEFMNGVVITNIHNDTYGSRNEVPIQGPFTNQWVGGRQSRHVPLNQGTDTYTTRPEAWKILMGTGSFSGSYQTAIGFVGADYPYPEGNEDEPSYPVRAHLRATYLREETAKRIVNFKNIRNSTGSLNLGNYDRNYQVVHSVGSTLNNRALLDAVNPTNNTELYGIVRTDVTDGRVDYQLPTRQRFETIIINRFSAPGDYRTMSRGYLNNYAEELSPYNVTNFRNRQVIGDGRRNGETLTNDKTQYPEIISGATGDLNTLLAKSSIFGGYQSGSATIPSIHKANRNPLTTVDYSGESSTQITKDNDNGFFTHPIPQNDAGYAWIRSSVETGSNAYYGYVDNRYVNGLQITYPSGSTSTFNSLQTISASQFGSYISGGYRLLGADINVSGGSQFLPTDFVGLNNNIYESSSYTTLGTTTYLEITGGLITGVSSGSEQFYFNNLLLNRNGPYGYPSFKQARNNYNPIVIKQNLDNYIALYKNNNFIIGKEPVVYYNKPNSLLLKNNFTDKILKFEHTYNNIKQVFENINLLNNLSFNEAKTFYDISLKLFLNNAQYKLLNYQVNSNIFPKKSEQFFTKWKNLEFNEYYESAPYWRTNKSDRIPRECCYSAWPMDNYLESFGYKVSASASEPDPNGVGILQNNVTVVHGGNPSLLTYGKLYAYKHMLSSILSYTSPNYSLTNFIDNPAYLNLQNYLSISSGLFGGNEPWSAAEQSGKAPYYNSQPDWLEDINVSKFKNYSIIPQYIISTNTKLNYILNNDLNNNETNKLNFGSGFETATDEEILPFTLSDNIFDVNTFNDDLKTNKIKISLNCNSIIKFNPIPDGRLYPQIVTTAVAGDLILLDTTWVNTKNNPTSFLTNRIFTTPLFAPGVLFNTIKSGVAVDYPILTSSLQITQSYFSSSTPVDYQINNDKFDKRIPFEAVLDPQRYLINTDLIYSDPHPSASINATSSLSRNDTINNIYKLKINNFLAETINFFLADSKLTTLYSKPESEFKTVDPSKEYRALVKMYKSSDGIKNDGYLYYNTSSYTMYTKPQFPKNTVETITMYSRPSGFGPACAGGTSGSSGYTKNIIDSTNGYYAPFTPPYYDGEAWALITYKPTGSVAYKPTLDHILSNAQVKYLRYEVVENELGTGGPQGKGNLNFNAMQLSASVNLFNIVNLSEITQNTTDSTTTNNVSKAWAIQTKFETPILNFQLSTPPNVVTGQVPLGTQGMWHQYGTIPTDTQGIYLQVTDVPEDFSRYGKEFDFRTAQDTSTRDPSLTGSLADIVGFSNSASKLGKIASSREIKEAVVAIPYIEENGTKRYIKLNDNAVRYLRKQYFGLSQDIEQVETDIALSLSDTIKKQFTTMKDYVFPPNFDFINNENIDPIAMYIFEFKYTLSQQDLADIWQGLLPDIGYKFEEQTSVITHELNENELIDKTNLNEKLKFFVFKVKQKAKNNYFERLVSSIKQQDTKKINILQGINRTDGIDFSQIDKELTYSYNWPYDFFSLVELAKIDAKIEYMNEEETILTNVSPKTFGGFKNKNNSITIPKGINSLKATLSNKPKNYSTFNQYQKDLTNTLKNTTIDKLGNVVQTSTKNNLEITQQTNVFNQSNTNISQNSLVDNLSLRSVLPNVVQTSTTTPRVLRNIVVEAIAPQAEQISSNPTNVDAVGPRSSTTTTTNVSTSSEVNPQTITAVATTNKVSVSTVTKPTATKPKLR